MFTWIAEIIFSDSDGSIIKEHMLVVGNDFSTAMYQVRGLYGDDVDTIKISRVDEGLITISSNEYFRILKEYGIEE